MSNTGAGLSVKKKKKKSRIVRKILLILLAVIVLGAAGLYAWSKLKAEYTTVYDQYAATVGTISNSLSFNGSFELVDSKTYTAAGNATVRNIYVRTGDKVKKGDRLIRLSDGSSFTADFDGTINKIDVKKDDDVTAGAELIQLADFDHMKVTVRIDEYDISSAHPGDSVTVAATATEKKYTSVIDNINYISSSGGNVAYYTGTMYVDVDGDVYPGMQVTVTLVKEEAADVVILKQDALSFDRNNKAFVYMQNDDETMKRVEVEVGVSNGNYVEIRSGIKAGDTVYAETMVKDTTVSSLFSGLFGGQRINGMGGGNNRNNRNWNPGGGNNNWNGGGTGGPSRPGGGQGGGR